MDAAVLGIGAIEQHGSHLPVGTDWIIARELAGRVADALGAIELPAIPVSMSECHGSFAGTMWLKPATLAAVVRDLVDSLRGRSIHRLLIVNCHGGNFILEPTIQDIHRDYPDFQIAMADENWPNQVDGRPLFETYDTDIHAGEVETSLMLHLFPELVQDERVDFIPACGREFLDYVTLDQISPAGIWGTPGKASAEKGRVAMDAQVRAIVDFAHRMFGEEPC